MSRSTLSRALLIEPQPFYTDRGTPIAVRQVLQALSELGWQVDVLTFPMGTDVSIPNVRIERVGNPLGFQHVKVGFSPQKLMLDGLIAARLRKRLRAEHYDVVHAVEESALICMALRNGQSPPLIYDMASSLPEQLAQHKAFGLGPLPRIFTGAEHWLLRGAACVVCSAGLGDHVRAASPGTPLREWRFPAEMKLAGADEVAALRQELGLALEAHVIVYVGNFAAYQGVDLLFDAAARVLAEKPAAALVCVGAATQAEAEAAAARFPPHIASRVRLVARQPRERIPAFLGLADMLVSPRSYGANFPLKLFDYLAVGKPIVATDIKAHTCVLNRNLAHLVPATSEGLARGILDLIEQPELGRALARSASAFAASELSWDSFKSLVGDIYATARSRPAAA